MPIGTSQNKTHGQSIWGTIFLIKCEIPFVLKTRNIGQMRWTSPIRVAGVLINNPQTDVHTKRNVKHQHFC